jgi:hypothetical protein
MSLLSEEEKRELIERRGFKSAKTGQKHRASNLEVHHMNRNPHDNRPQNLKLLTKKEHDELHKRRK